MPKPVYDKMFYSDEGPGNSLSSARIVVPIIQSIVRPSSVVDVGCGSGVWLSVFRELGVQQIFGIEGNHLDPKWLCIPRDLVKFMDLSQPFKLDSKFELAVCLEVAEHLPQESASSLVDSLVRLAPVILFSAAVPLQGGTHHVNEQWPAYWRTLFSQHGFRMLDLIRKEIWLNPNVQPWYRQNMFLMVREDLIPEHQIFREAEKFSDDLLLIHPSILDRQMGLRSMARNLPKSIGRASRYLLNRLRRTS